ncbi:MAG: hypothetical protein WKG32_05000 [Gemmatimonadaceae bacterium]
MSDDDAIIDLLRQAPFSFVGTIEQLGGATMDVPVDDRTAVVYVDRVLHGPDVMRGLGGQRITLQLAADVDPPAIGTTATFFAHGLAFGESVAVAEVGRLPLEAVEPRMRLAAGAREPAFAAFERRLATTNLCEHADQADAVVLGRVVKLEKAPATGAMAESSISEHDPDWWVATLLVHHVERGDVEPGEVLVLYANSLDVRWRDVPKPKASQSGLWLLHRPDGELAYVAPFELCHAEDRQPVQSLDAMRQYWS